MKKYNYRVVFDATVRVTEKGLREGETDCDLFDVACSWSKSPESALKGLFDKVERCNSVGYRIITVTKYRIECRN